MKKFLLLFVLILTSNYSFSQSANSNSETFRVIEVQPQFPGGMKGFYTYVSKNLSYPEDAKAKQIEGKVLIEYIIDEEGNIIAESVKVFEGIFPSLDNEAVRLIKESPKWNPGRITENGEFTKVRMRMPILFKIQNKKEKKK